MELNRDVDATLRINVDFIYRPARPAIRPTMNDPGDPPEPAEIDIQSIWVGGKELDLSEISSDYLDMIADTLLERMDEEEEAYHASRQSGREYFGT